jgi:hypothetical protein
MVRKEANNTWKVTHHLGGAAAAGFMHTMQPRSCLRAQTRVQRLHAAGAHPTFCKCRMIELAMRTDNCPGMPCRSMPGTSLVVLVCSQLIAWHARPSPLPYRKTAGHVTGSHSRLSHLLFVRLKLAHKAVLRAQRGKGERVCGSIRARVHPQTTTGLPETITTPHCRAHVYCACSPLPRQTAKAAVVLQHVAHEQGRAVVALGFGDELAVCMRMYVRVVCGGGGGGRGGLTADRPAFAWKWPPQECVQCR